MISTNLQSVYSQGPEQKIILKHLSDIKNPSVIDIGAHDGKTNSNSLALIERGWRALLIEPSPFAFAKLLALHAGNRNVTLLNAAVGIDDRIVQFWDCQGDQYGTTHRAQAAIWTERGIKYESYWVPQVSMQTVANQLGASAHVLSIDCEGASVDILMSCSELVRSWDTQIIIVEHDQRIVELSGWARERKYECIGITAENMLLMKSE